MGTTTSCPDTKEDPGHGPAFRLRLAGAALLVPAVFLLGCEGPRSPLALQDPFYASPATTVRHVASEARTLVNSYRELPGIQHACRTTGEAVRDASGVPPAACRAPAAGFYGRQAEAFRRWVEDQIRELPAPTEAASAAGN